MKPTYILIAILATSMIAAVQIDTVYYDALDESGSEFIILRNTGSVPVNLTGWTIATPTSDSDATLEGMIEEKFIIADTDFGTSKDNQSWPNANHEEAITLPNSAGFVSLINPQNAHIDTLGYGASNTSETNPHPGAQEGYALVRIQDTDNNEEDFVEAKPFSELVSNNSEQTVASQQNFSVTIRNSPPVINISYPDESDEEGIQILPIPGHNKTVLSEITIKDNNTIDGIIIQTNLETLTLQGNQTETTIAARSAITTDSEQIEINITDKQTEQFETSITLIPVVSLHVSNVPSTMLWPGEKFSADVTVTNTGTANTDLHIFGLRPVLSDLAFGTMTYSILGTQYTLDSQGTTHYINMRPEDQLTLNLSIEAGYVPSGTYSGQLVVAGVSV